MKTLFNDKRRNFPSKILLGFLRYCSLMVPLFRVRPFVFFCFASHIANEKFAWSLTWSYATFEFRFVFNFNLFTVGISAVRIFSVRSVLYLVTFDVFSNFQFNIHQAEQPMLKHIPCVVPKIKETLEWNRFQFICNGKDQITLHKCEISIHDCT